MVGQRLTDKVAVITGGSSGIGLATARLFQAEGARVLIVGRDPAALERARAELGGDTRAVQADVSTLAGIDAVVAEAREAFGRIDVLFANAGMSECPPLEDTDEAFFDRIMDLNVKGVFFAFTRALPLLANGASAIFTSSVAHDRGRPGDPLYAASKAAVRSLARTLAADAQVLARGIRVNVVSPGAIQTPLTAHADEPELAAQVDAYITEAVPMKRWGRPEEVARAVLFLASAESSYLTGGEIAVDGGLGQI
jgi:NAD(P)-dependent dehydrogenase (short-subunit alcohol dehydrogenase family)